MATLASPTTPHSVLTMEAVVRLAPVQRVSSEELEDATMEVERTLAEHTLDLTDGASASANFAEGTVEIDLQLTGGSVGELHQRIALVITQLDRYCGLNIGLPSDIPRPPMTVQSSATQVLVPS